MRRRKGKGKRRRSYDGGQTKVIRNRRGEGFTQIEDENVPREREKCRHSL